MSCECVLIVSWFILGLVGTGLTVNRKSIFNLQDVVGLILGPICLILYVLEYGDEIVFWRRGPRRK
jgi:Na+/proline symporter